MLFDRLLREIRAFSQHEHKTLTDAWLRMKEMLRNCHGHNLTNGNIIKIFYHSLNETTQEAIIAAAGGIYLYKTPNRAYQLLEDKVLLKLDWAKNQKPKTSLKKTVPFADEGSSNSNIDKSMARMDAMAIKMNAQYKEIQSRAKCNHCGGNIMDGVDIENLTIEQYLELTKENHAPSVGDWFEAELEKCWKIQQKRDNSYLNLRREVKDDALRNWEAQIDQLRRQEHEVSECKMVHTSKNDAQQKETNQIERISSLPEKPNPGSFTIPCSVDIFNINGIADLGASVNIMSKSVLEELSLADPKYANIIVEMAYKTSEHLNERPTSQDELSYGAGNTDSKTHWCEPVRQEHKKGYTFWASCDPYHEICDGGGILDKKLKHYWKSTNDNDRIGLEWEGLSCPTGLGRQTQEKTIMKEHEDPEKCRETKTRAIIGAMINKLPEEWFSGVSRDMDDLEGIIDYLEPTLYDRFIDHNDEAYK
ncbi:hypothetical protein Tco_0717928 [Tanacetum coccineum]